MTLASGRVFGRLMVIVDRGWKHVDCICSCGRTKTVRRGAMQSGLTRSCGCLQRETASTLAERTCLSHGQAGKTPTYATWVRMIGRCGNQRNQRYGDYGGRGISVCERWRASFQAFYDDMGQRPDGCSLDRIDNNGNYEPSNCRWATTVQQARNRRMNHVISSNGARLTVAEWSERTSIPAHTIISRLSAGWTESESVTKPRRAVRSYTRRIHGKSVRILSVLEQMRL